MNKSGQVGKYIYCTKPIGKGSFSKVYKGFDTETDDIIAIKIIEKSRLKPELVERLHAEIKLIPQLQHPHIVELLDFMEDPKRFYLVFEYCAGGDLAHLLQAGRIKEDRAREYMQQMIDALRYIKARNIIHRDLKPHNIMLSADRKTIKITDFNFARELYDNDLAQTLCGSPLYMAPEIIEREDYSVKSDLWSVGIILYELVYGKSPYWDSINILDLVKKIKERNINYPQIVSAECINLMKKLLQRDPKKRITWEELFMHEWLQFDEPTFLPEEPDQMWESISMSTFGSKSASVKQEKTVMIEPRRFKVNLIEDYTPIGATPPVHAMSEPINIYKVKQKDRPTSSSESTISQSAPGPMTLTDHLWGYMSGSVEVIKGAIDYIGAIDPRTNAELYKSR